MAAVTPSASPARSGVKPIQRATATGPYFVDFRAAMQQPTVMHSSGTERQLKVEVAGLARLALAISWDTSYLFPLKQGELLHEQYLTASYRVYLNEADAKKVFAYIKHLQETSPV